MNEKKADEFGACKTLVIEREGLTSTLPFSATLINFPLATSMDLVSKQSLLDLTTL